jgi:hypothetical protein
VVLVPNLSITINNIEIGHVKGMLVDPLTIRISIL